MTVESVGRRRTPNNPDVKKKSLDVIKQFVYFSLIVEFDPD